MMLRCVAIQNAASTDLIETILHRQLHDLPCSQDLQDLPCMYLPHDDDAKHRHCSYKYCCLAVSEYISVAVLSMA